MTLCRTFFSIQRSKEWKSPTTHSNLTSAISLRLTQYPWWQILSGTSGMCTRQALLYQTVANLSCLLTNCRLQQFCVWQAEKRRPYLWDKRAPLRLFNYFTATHNGHWAVQIRRFFLCMYFLFLVQCIWACRFAWSKPDWLIDWLTDC